VSKSFVVPGNTVVVVDRITHWLDKFYDRSSCSSVFSMKTASSSPLRKMSSLDLPVMGARDEHMNFYGPFVLLEGATLTSSTKSTLANDDHFPYFHDSSFPGIDDYNQDATRTACTTTVEVIARSYDLTDYMNGDVCY
jgi:hypothetical protein